MNAYVYAPKGDPKHRDRWRDAYDAAEIAAFRRLAEHTARQGTRFGFALSPGLDIDYRSDRDREALLAKLAPLLDAGVQWVVLALDDIPNRPGLAVEQAELTDWLLDALRSRRPDPHLTLVPTEYIGTRPTSYLEDLAAGLPSDVDVMWTGPTVCSPVIRAADARAWAGALDGRRPLLWDNYPVNDGTMDHSLHLGPYRGREPELTDELDGVLCNPMLQPHASEVALATAADFLCGPDEYDPAASWSRAIAAVGKSRAPALGALASACADGPLLPPQHLEANVLVTALVDAAGDPAWPGTVRAVRDHFAAAQDARRAWADAGDEPLAAELEPWLGAAVVEAEAGLAALRLIQHTYPVARIVPDGTGKAVGPDAELAMVHAFAAVFSWSAARRSQACRVRPAFRVLPGRHPARRRPTGTRRRSRGRRRPVRDRPTLPLRARARYRVWAQRSPEPLRITVDGAPADVELDGSFSAPDAAVVVVAAGPDATEILSADSTLPFPDARLA